MKVFLIGGTGYIGRATARALATAGHTPVVLARSAESAAKLPDDRVEFVAGTTSDTGLLIEQSAAADAVVYLAVPGLTGATEADKRAVPALLKTLAGSGKSFVLTSGLAVYQGVDAAVLTPDTPTAGAAASQAWRVELENTVLSAGDAGVRSAVIRPSVVYGAGGVSGLVTALTRYVSAGNASFFIGDGANSISTVHVDDLAQVFVRTLDAAPSGCSLNVAGGSVLGYDLALAVSAATGSSLAPVSLTIPEAIAAIGPAGATLAMDFKVSGWQLASQHGWSPRRSSLLLEMAQGRIQTS